MPNASSTGLNGERYQESARGNAEYNGLDEEMLRAFALRRNLPDLAKPAMQAFTSPGVIVLLQPSVAGNGSIRRRSPDDRATRLGCLERQAQLS
jgi:hypothetical protein